MNTEQIGQQVQAELQELMKVHPIESIEFSISEKVHITPAFKTIVWFELNPKNLQRIYKGVCEKFTLPYNQSLTGQYIYIRIS